MQAIGDQSRIVRIPLNRVGDLKKINTKWAEFEQKFEREPTREELAEALDMPVEELITTIRWNARNTSIDAPVASGEEATLLDFIGDDSAPNPDSLVMTNSLRVEIARSLAALGHREHEVLIRYYGLNGETPIALHEIGTVLGITTERVRQIKETGLRKLRQMASDGRLRAYLG